MVDSIPNSQGPPSRMKSSFPSGLTPRSSTTCSALDGLMRPKVLQDGAVKPRKFGPAKALRSACAQGWDGQRSATVSCPPVTKNPHRGFFLSTMVSGPGQKARASIRASGGTFSAQASIASGPQMWTMSGWFVGRPFTRKVASTALRLSASAARP